ncbi:hypothetical protein EEL31_17870 [Brevibacillus laterosporus]|nr:hypothetical protein EEL31_17870 [Brevibacillus laterosporus]
MFVHLMKTNQPESPLYMLYMFYISYRKGEPTRFYKKIQGIFFLFEFLNKRKDNAHSFIQFLHYIFQHVLTIRRNKVSY